VKKLAQFLLLVFLLALTITVFFGISLYRFTNSPLPMPNSEPELVFVIPKGVSTPKIAHLLYGRGIVKHPAWFLWIVKYKKAWGKLKAGEYMIKQGTTPLQLIDQFVEARVIQYALTIVEGWNFEQLMATLNAHPKLDHTLMNLSFHQIMEKLGHPNEHPEGRFLPETYFFPAETTDVAFLKRAYHLLEKKLATLWATRSSTVSLKSPYEALILASIIEKESSVKEEYAEISGVYSRRLVKNMPLQADPCVIYGLGNEYKGQLTSALLKKPTPYNTYQNTGLPPTPIAMPGIKALEGAVNPKPGDTLYFVAKKDGKGHIFSKTLVEHNSAVQEYRKGKGQGEGVTPSPTLPAGEGV